MIGQPCSTSTKVGIACNNRTLSVTFSTLRGSRNLSGYRRGSYLPRRTKLVHIANQVHFVLVVADKSFRKSPLRLWIGRPMCRYKLIYYSGVELISCSSELPDK